MSGEEGEECRVCLDVLPKETWRGNERYRSLCCGKQLCQICAKATQQKTLDDLQALHTELYHADRFRVDLQSQSVLRRISWR